MKLSKEVKQIALFFASAVTLFVLFYLYSVMLHKYSSVKFLLDNILQNLVLAVAILVVILTSYRNATKNRFGTRLRNAKLFTILIITVSFVLLSMKLDDDLSDAQPLPNLETCDYYDSHANLILTGTVVGTCMDIDVKENTSEYLNLQFSETYVGNITDDGYYGYPIEEHETTYVRHGGVQITYVDGAITRYDITEEISYYFDYQEKDLFVLEMQKQTIINEYDEDFTSTKTTYYLKQTQEGAPTYEETNLSNVVPTIEVITVSDGIVYINDIETELDDRLTRTDTTVVTSKDVANITLTNAFTTFQELSLLTSYDTNSSMEVHREFDHYVDPFTKHIHIEESDGWNRDLFVIREIEFGYCLEKRIDFGYDLEQNIFLYDEEYSQMKDYLNYYELLYPSGYYSGDVIYSNNPILDYL